MKILLAYDGSASSDAAIEDLRKGGLPSKAEALVVCVADGNLTPPQHVGSIETDFNTASTVKLSEAETLAETAKQRIASYFPQWTISSEALWGAPATVVMDTSAWWHPDLIVVGSHGHSLVVRVLLGSTSLELVHNAPCSVRVARPGGASVQGGPLRIIVGHDGSKEADAMMDAVAGRSWPAQTEVQIILVEQTLVPTPIGLEVSTFSHEPAYNVIREADEHERVRLQRLADDVADLFRRAGLIASSIVVDGQPGEVIVEEAERTKADVIFVGARGLGRIDRLLLGSVSTHVVTHAHCTVEVVRRVGEAE
jgi:nucleotide-binding universal stress UspA family protein